MRDLDHSQTSRMSHGSQLDSPLNPARREQFNFRKLSSTGNTLELADIAHVWMMSVEKAWLSDGADRIRGQSCIDDRLPGVSTSLNFYGSGNERSAAGWIYQGALQKLLPANMRGNDDIETPDVLVINPRTGDHVGKLVTRCRSGNAVSNSSSDQGSGEGPTLPLPAPSNDKGSVANSAHYRITTHYQDDLISVSAVVALLVRLLEEHIWAFAAGRWITAGPREEITVSLESGETLHVTLEQTTYT